MIIFSDFVFIYVIILMHFILVIIIFIAIVITIAIISDITGTDFRLLARLGVDDF
jgi:hypothetical protein